VEEEQEEEEQEEEQEEGREEPPTLGDVRSLAVFLTVCHHFLNYGRKV